MTTDGSEQNLNAVMRNNGDVYGLNSLNNLAGTVADEWLHLVREMGDPQVLPGVWFQCGWRVQANWDVDGLPGREFIHGLRLDKVGDVWMVSSNYP